MADLTIARLISRASCEQTEKAATILSSAHNSSSSFLAQFVVMRKGKRAGSTTDAEQDMLRAMLAFASSGLDAMAKQLVRDCLETVIEKKPESMAQLKGHLQNILSKEGSVNVKLLIDVLVSDDARKSLVEKTIAEITSSSLQSLDEIMRIGALLGVETRAICADPNRVRTIFFTRNRIVHEMDIDFSQRNRSRRHRKIEDMIGYTNELFLVGDRLLGEVDRTIGKVS